jgi:hypothetical protein
MSAPVQPLHLAVLSTVMLRNGYFVRAATSGTETHRTGFIVHHGGNVRLFFADLAGVEGLARSAGVWPPRGIPETNADAIAQIFDGSLFRAAPYVVSEPVGPSYDWISQAKAWTGVGAAELPDAGWQAVSLTSFAKPTTEQPRPSPVECHGITVINKMHRGGTPRALPLPSALSVTACGEQEWTYLFAQPASPHEARHFRGAMLAQEVCRASPSWMRLPSAEACAFARFDPTARYSVAELAKALGVKLGSTACPT